MATGKALREKWSRGEPTFGPFVGLGSLETLEIIGHAGFDFAIMDTEHGPLSIETAQGLLSAADATGLTPIVRVTENNEPMILRALDIGAAGVQVPQISTKADAEKVVRGAKYTPWGARGLSPFTRSTQYGASLPPDFTDRANVDTLVIIHVEGKEGLDNLDDILTVPHIDVIFLGPYDISQSLGMPGQVNHPTVLGRISEAVRKARDRGAVVGSFARDVATGGRWVDLGVLYVSVGVDMLIFLEACQRMVKELKG